jgi:hypothetical protein
MIPKKKFTPLLVASAVALAMFGCTTNEPPIDDIHYFLQDSPDHVLRNLQTAYKSKDIAEYAKLLAEDFQFYFDPDTRADKGLPEYWNRFTDSTQTGKVFASNEVNDIRISMTYSPTPLPVDELGRTTWQLINVGDEFLEVELKATPGQVEGITLVVDGQIQKFYFRRGKTPDDSLSSLFYITEWRDLGVQL